MMHVNKRLFEKGEGTKTDMLETQARLDIAEAQLTEAQDNVPSPRARPWPASSAWTRASWTSWARASVRPRSRPAASPSGRRSRARTTTSWRRPAWRSRTRAWRSARTAQATIRVSTSSPPTARATTSRSTPTTQDTVNRAVGVQVNIPIYQGGAISATVRQAAAGYERAQSDLDARTNKVLVELRKAHSIVLSSVHKIEALEKAVASGKELMKATEQSIKGGVRINLDLLNAQQQLYTSQRDLAQARYSYLIGLLRLRAAAGTLDASSVREVAAYFH
jgi:protease secretion system outer membrane protein